MITITERLISGTWLNFSILQMFDKTNHVSWLVGEGPVRRPRAGGKKSTHSHFGRFFN
jgi:hypothetical protein